MLFPARQREWAIMAAPFDDLTARRIAENEATFRHANEQIEDAAVDHRVRRPPFICECADPRCTELLELELGEYEAVRSSPVSFFVAPGHERADGPDERVIRDAGRYRVVEKLGDAADVARELYPRNA
jgi:hypothetical protein